MINPQIMTLIEVADAGSFSKAAEKMYLSTVSIMNQVNAIEKRFGIKLFNRTNQGVTLTAAGQSLYNDAKEIITASDEAIKKARRIANVEQSVIHIGTSIMRPCKPLLDLWAKVNDGTLPYRIKIVPFEDDPVGLAAMERTFGKEIDCFVSPCDIESWKHHFTIYPIGKCKCRIAVPRSHPLARKKLLTWADLSGETLLLVKRGQSVVLDRMRDEIAALHPDVNIYDAASFYDLDTFNICEQRGYLMEVPENWAEAHPSIVTIPVEWDYELSLAVLCPKHPSKAVTSFMELVKTAIPVD